jgi:alpha-tubulin suppressor-like RCC1 family protein
MRSRIGLGLSGVLFVAFASLGCDLFPPAPASPTLPDAAEDSESGEETAPGADSSTTDIGKDSGNDTDLFPLDTGAVPDTLPDSAETATDSGSDTSSDVSTDSSTDSGSSCSGGLTSCGTKCVDAQNDRTNCGTCGNVCAFACTSGLCRKPMQLAVGINRASVVVEGGAVFHTGPRMIGMASTPAPVSCLGGSNTCFTSPARFTSVTNVKQIAEGGYHACAVRTDGSVHCWGSNNAEGELGNATSTGTPPVVVPIPAASQVDVSENCNKAWCLFSCAVLTDATVRCWGGNAFGGIGNGTTSSSKVPPTSPTGLSGIAQVSTGGGFACARTSSGTVKCWGLGSNGQIGITPTTTCLGPTCQLTPVDVPGLAGVAEIAAGLDHVCARLTSGAVRCWGGGYYGQRGDGTASSGPTITAVSGVADAVEIASGDGFSCARRSDNSVWCWGNNARGQLGDGSTTLRTLPVRALAAGSAIDLAVGGFMFGYPSGSQAACALSPVGGVSCWGGNAVGQLGNGTLTDKTVATPMVWR